MSEISDRFWSKVRPAAADECWLWQRSVTKAGYGRFCHGNQRWMAAHRWAYEQMRAEVPAGLVLDHLCRVHGCVNPWHLEPVTHAVNALRGRLWEREKTHCPKRHPYDEVNTYVTPDGHRECRICRRAALNRFRQRARSLALAS